MIKAHITLYTRPGCHLCEEMKLQIAAAGCQEMFVLEEVNIDNDAELAARFGCDIPVLNINGKEAFRHRLTSAEFKAALDTALAQL